MSLIFCFINIIFKSFDVNFVSAPLVEFGFVGNSFGGIISAHSRAVFIV